MIIFMIIGIVSTIRFIRRTTDRLRARFGNGRHITCRDLEQVKQPARRRRSACDEPAILIKERVILMDYTDAEGETTLRKVQTQSYKPHSKLLYAHCQLAEENRTFRIDRINAATDSKNQPIPNVMAYLATIHRDA